MQVLIGYIVYIATYTEWSIGACLLKVVETKLNIEIKTKSDMPMYEQIKMQIINAILNDELKEGEQLDSIRGLAKKLHISVITTTKAYNELENEGYIIAVSGKGYYVAGKDNELFQERLQYSIYECFDKAIEYAHRLEMKNEEIIDLLKRELEVRDNE